MSVCSSVLKANVKYSAYVKEISYTMKLFLWQRLFMRKQRDIKENQGDADLKGLKYRTNRNTGWIMIFLCFLKKLLQDLNYS